MAITLDTFRAFAAGKVSDKKTVNVGDAAKTALAQERFTGDRPLTDRTIVQLEATQDNIYVRSQLLTAVRDSLGGENNAFFREMEAKLLGVSADHPQADVALASTPLTVREVRAVLSGLDRRLQLAAFERSIDQVFATHNNFATGNRYRELVKLALMPAAEARLLADPKLSSVKLMEPDSTFALLRDVLPRTSRPMRLLIQLSGLSENARRAFLKAALVMLPREPHGMDILLADKAEQLARMKEKHLTPVKIFKVICPDTAWPAELSSKKNGPLTDQDRELLTQARNGGMLDRLMAEAGEPNLAQAELDRRSARYGSCSTMFELGMSRADVEKVLDNPETFRCNMIPTCGYLCGEQDVGRGADSAYNQLVKDACRGQVRITLDGPRNESWRAPAPLAISTHPMHELARQETRQRIEAFCGPDATESMKANVFLAMSQNAQMSDAIVRPLLGLSAGGVNGYSYALSRNEDGSVTVQRNCNSTYGAYIYQAHRFYPDGSQKLEGSPRQFRQAGVTQQIVNDARAEDDRRLQATSKADLRDYISRHYGKAFAALFAEEIAAMKTAYPTAVQAKESYVMSPVNILGLFFGEDDDEARRFLALSDEDRLAALPTFKTRLLPRAKAEMMKFALDEVYQKETAETLRARASTLGGRVLDLSKVPVETSRIHEKLSYLEFDDDHLTEAAIRAAYDRVRDQYLAERTAVLDVIKGLAGEEAVLREELLSDALTHPRLKADGYRLMLDIARDMPIPPVDAELTEEGVKEALLNLGRRVTEAFSHLDSKVYGGYEKGNMTSLITAYILGVHRPALEHLFAQLAPGRLEAVLADLDPGYVQSDAGATSPEYLAYLTRLKTKEIVEPIIQELGLR